MSGQSASLTLKEACAMQHRVQASGSHANSNGGGKKRANTGDSVHKKAHTSKKNEPSEMEGK
jgi:hypothetical protein